MLEDPDSAEHALYGMCEDDANLSLIDYLSPHIWAVRNYRNVLVSFEQIVDGCLAVHNFASLKSSAEFLTAQTFFTTTCYDDGAVFFEYV